MVVEQEHCLALRWQLSCTVVVACLYITARCILDPVYNDTTDGGVYGQPVTAWD